MYDEPEPPLSCFEIISPCFRYNNSMTIITLIAVFLGGTIGFALRSNVKVFTARDLYYLNITGDLFLRMLQCLQLFVVTSSLISGISRLNWQLSRKIVMRYMILALLTTFQSTLVGLAAGLMVEPGVLENEKDVDSLQLQPIDIPEHLLIVDAALDFGRNLVPDNIVQACYQQVYTVLMQPNDTNNTDLTSWRFEFQYKAESNLVGLIFMSIIVGCALSILEKDGIYLTRFFCHMSNMSMKITKWVICISPFFVLFLVLARISEVKSLSLLLSQLGLYCFANFLGHSIQMLFILPFLFYVLTKKNPFRFLWGTMDALVTAFGTASSAATMPLTIECLIKNGVDYRIAHFAVPIGIAISMDGTAIYQVIATLFIIQMRQIELSFINYVLMVMAATGASVGAAGIPHGGLLTLVIVFRSVGLPTKDVSVILAIDWIVDRFRTAVNVSGAAFIAAITHHLSKQELEAIKQRSKLRN